MKHYTKEKLREVIFPLGGIGTGSIGLCGNGNLRDFEIFNSPQKGTYNGFTHFALRLISPDGRVFSRILCGDSYRSEMGQYRQGMYTGYGFGADRESFAGLPHFRNTVFTAAFPFADLSFSDPDFPLSVKLEAFNPFIPCDAENSGLPAAFFRITLENDSDTPYTADVGFSVTSPFSATHTTESGALYIESTADRSSVLYRDMTVVSLDGESTVEPYWYRGQWMDGITTYWNTVNGGEKFKNRSYGTPGENETGTVSSRRFLSPGESRTFRFLLTWNCPNRKNDWDILTPEEEKRNFFRNYYATRFADSRATAAYCTAKYEELYQKSKVFSKLLQSLTLSPAMTEAVTDNLAVFKSPTVIRLEDGTLWGFEGVHERIGSCPGTCTHVWNYEYALPYLFPELERSMRYADFKYNQESDGRLAFRIGLPLGRTFDHRPCVDGMTGSIIKVYREWKMSGDNDFLIALYPSVKKAVDFFHRGDNEWRWDADTDGVLEGRQHHTLDLELFGAHAWLEGMYIAALEAASQMATAVGDTDNAEKWHTLAEKGRRYTESELFNGEYYIQTIDLADRERAARHEAEEYYWNRETGELKYQIGEGCEIDQLLGEWHARLCGLPPVFAENHRKSALQAIFRHNFKTSFRDFPNLWRVFADNDESGTVMCDYPTGTRKPKIPISYTEECMTGFEYAFAGLLLSENMEKEAEKTVSAIRMRYDGEKRNPFNEMECGSNYVRAAASFALVPLMAGFTADMTKKTLAFHPVTDARPFRTLFAAANTYGSAVFRKNALSLTVLGKPVTLCRIVCPLSSPVTCVTVDGKDIPYQELENGVAFGEKTVERTLVIRMA